MLVRHRSENCFGCKGGLEIRLVDGYRTEKNAFRKQLFAVIILFVILSGSAMADSPARIISLAPNLTEILYHLDLGDRIVAVTSYCDYPPQAKAKTKIGGMANPSLEAIVALRPDIVVMTDDGNTAAFAERLQSLGIRIYIFRARRLDELPEGIKNLGMALGVKERAVERAEGIERFINRMNKRTQETSIQTARKVLFVVQPHPLIVAGSGTAIDDSLKLLGLHNIALDVGSKYPKFSLEEVIRCKPDLIMIGRGPGMADDDAKNLLKKLESLDAVKNGRVCYINDPLFRLGPRIIEGIREVDACACRR